MNEYDIYDAQARWQDHPALGPATATLRNLMGCANANSDGWAYWPKPARAAEKLMALIEGDGTHESRYGDREDVTIAQVKAAYRPIKSFLTRHKLECEIVEPWAKPAAPAPAPLNATVTVSYGVNSVTFALDGTELQTDTAGGPYLGTASRGFIADEVAKALIKVTTS